ncbi:hypothetical protein [Aurantibacillus circumpalustris]|uniref:hypothetical protein n=1 Tax=Aurantibacillus circumpalustris TaxID=3036359 RepID=UPI00295BFE3A|nr:hypothetical protein [Aurantibacillus circumpalustris]
MKQEDKLKNTLSEYFDNQEVPYNENEWERASAYLSNARHKRKIRYVMVILIVLFSTIFVGLFNFQTLSKEAKQLTSHYFKQTRKPSPTPPVEAILKSMVSKSKPTIIPKRSKKPLGFSHIEVTKKKNQTTISKVQPTLHSNEPSQIFESNMIESALNSQAQTITENTTNSIDNNTSAAPITFKTLTANPANEKEEIKHEPHLDSVEKKVLVVTRDKPLHNQDPLAEKEIALQSIVEFPQKEKTVSDLNDTKKETAIAEAIELSNPEEKINTPFIDTLVHSEIDEFVNETKAFDDTLSEHSSIKELTGEGFFYEAGAVVYYGWKGPANRDASGFSPLAGINYMNQLSNKCSVSFGVQYLQVRNLSNSSKTSRVSTYEYGEKSDVTVVTPSTMHYLVAPLRFHYYLNERNCFGVGMNLAYLLNIDAKVTTYNESPGIKENHKTITLSGYTEGFSWFDSQVALFYKRRITRSLGLQAEIFLGLTDVKQNDFFGLNYKERNSGLKLSLVYFAFTKKNRR